jgi:hypothetical protein
LIDDAAQFINNPASLGDIKWAGIGAAWYWTVQRPDINALSDAGDVRTVTLRINGGTNGSPTASPATSRPSPSATAYSHSSHQSKEMTPCPNPHPDPMSSKRFGTSLRLRWNMLGGHTLVEAVAQIRDKICGTADADKQGVQ